MYYIFDFETQKNAKYSQVIKFIILHLSSRANWTQPTKLTSKKAGLLKES